MISNYCRSLFSSSYWHAEQGMGKFYATNQLEGYYNDLTGKTLWQGPVNKDGIPLNSKMDNTLICHPTTIVQKALGHWDKWIESGRTDDLQKNEFQKIAQWGMDNQDSQGGFKIWSVLDMEAATDYSAMTQGEWASFFARMFSISGDQEHAEAADKALKLMIKPCEEGGTARLNQYGLILEERPFDPPNTILNGWISAIFGLHDYSIIRNNKTFREALDSTLAAFVHKLKEYNAGFWSYYDTNGNIAGPFYQKLHIAQLIAMEKAFPDIAPDITSIRGKFEVQQKSSIKRFRAIIHKAFQKLIHPPKAVLK